MVAAAALAGNFVCSAPVVTATFGTFLLPVTSAFGWHRAAFSMALTIVSIIGVFMLPIAGRFADRYGIRRVVIVGNMAFSASIALLAVAGGHIAYFYVGYAIVAVTSSFTSTVLLSRVVSAWFTRTRGLFLGLTAGIGNGLGCAAMPLLTMHLTATYGWRDAYLGLGICVLIIGAPAFLLAFHLPRKSPPSYAPVDDAPYSPKENITTASRTAVFWQILVAIALGGGSLSAIFTHVVPVLSEKQLNGDEAMMITVIALSSTSWQVALGRLLDITKSPRFAATCILLSAIGVFIFGRAVSTTTLVESAIMIGIGNGSEYALLSYIIPRYFGLKSFNEIYGTILGVVILLMGVMPTLMDMTFDITRSYGVSISTISALLAITSAMVFRLPAYRYSTDGDITMHNVNRMQRPSLQTPTSY